MEPTAPPKRSLSTVTIVLITAGVLCALGTVPVGILAAIAVPNFLTMQLKAKRAELPGNVDGIKTAELAYDAAFDGFVPVGSEAEARRVLGKTPHAWVGGPDWERIGWSPGGPVRGGYWVEVGAGDFEVHALCDVDGDGEPAEYVATRSTNATLVTAPDVY